MNILAQLTIENIKLNRRRTIVTIVGVALSCALIVAVAGMVASFRQMMIDVAVNEYGNYHDMYENVSQNGLTIIKQNPDIASYYYGRIEINDETKTDYLGNGVIDRNSIEITDKYDDNAEWRGVFVRYKNIKDYERVRSDIMTKISEVDGKHTKIRTNSELMRYEGVMGNRLFQTILGLAAVVISIIVICSVFVIRNSFSISATERMRQFGLLMSIGATTWQIRTLVYIEGAIIAIFGIILGTAIGVLADIVLVWIINILLKEMLSMTNGMIEEIRFVLPAIVPLSSALFTIIIVFFSGISAARRAAKLSPIGALQGTQDYKIDKKIRSSKLIKKLFGIGGVVADKNLRRSRQKYRTTVISLVVSIAVFIGLSSLTNYGSKVIGLQYANINYDIITITDNKTILEQIKSVREIDDIYVYREARTSTIDIYILDNETFSSYARSVGAKEDDYSRTVILNDYVLENINGKREVKKTTNIDDGDDVIVEIMDYDDDYRAIYNPLNLHIAKTTDKQPNFSKDSYFAAYYISDDYYQIQQIINFADERIMDYHILISANNSSSVAEKIEQLYEKESDNTKSFYIDNVSQDARIMRNMHLLLSIFLYGFVIVISLIGLTNIFNTISTNIALRAKEFAILKSVGMTNKEFNRMIRLESALYSLKSLMIGVPLGVVLSYLVYHAIANSFDYGYVLPLNSIIISIAVVAILVFAIMGYSVKQVDKQNIIETIRNDNI